MPKIKVLVSRESSKQKLRISKRITEDYRGKDLLLVGVLKADSYFWPTLQGPLICP